MAELEQLRETIKILQWIIFFGTITFFVSHLTIIVQLPKIKRLLEKLCYEEEEE